MDLLSTSIFIYWIYVLTISKLKVANCSGFPFCLVESKIRIATNHQIPSNSSNWSNSILRGILLANKTTLLGYQKLVSPSLTSHHQILCFFGKGWSHSSPPKEGKSSETKWKLQTPGTGGNPISNISMWAKNVPTFWYILSHISFLFLWTIIFDDPMFAVFDYNVFVGDKWNQTASTEVFLPHLLKED